MACATLLSPAPVSLRCEDVDTGNESAWFLLREAKHLEVSLRHLKNILSVGKPHYSEHDFRVQEIYSIILSIASHFFSFFLVFFCYCLKGNVIRK